MYASIVSAMLWIETGVSLTRRLHSRIDTAKWAKEQGVKIWNSSPFKRAKLERRV